MLLRELSIAIKWVTRRIGRCGNLFLVILTILVLNLFVLHLIFENTLNCSGNQSMKRDSIQKLILTNRLSTKTKIDVTQKPSIICGNRSECENLLSLQRSITNILKLRHMFETKEYRTILRFQSFVNELLPVVSMRKSRDIKTGVLKTGVIKSRVIKTGVLKTSPDNLIIENESYNKTERKTDSKTTRNTTLKSTINGKNENIIKTTIQSRTKTSIQSTQDPPQKLTHKPVQIYSCPEVYKSSTFGYPYFLHGFVRENCTRPSFNQSVSFILDVHRFEPTSLTAIVNSTSRIFHELIVIIDSRHTPTIPRQVLTNEKTRIIFKSDKPVKKLGQALNEAVKLITTPYTIIASNLAKFDNWTDIERLINVEEATSAQIVGSAVKYVDQDGTWDRGCYQTRLKLYTLKYEHGYRESMFSCLYCNHIVSPFLARTKTLETYMFNSELNSGVYRDLFLRIPDHGIMSCPDVLFYINTKSESDVQLSEFADEHGITKLVEISGKTRWFGKRRGFNNNKNAVCKRFLKSTAVPPDCRQNLYDAIIFVLNTCEKNNITCELQEGTLVGALKFNHILPWERDADITILSADFDKFKNLQREFSKEGYSMTVRSPTRCCFEGVVTGGSMAIYANGWLLELWGQHRLTSVKSSRTKMKMGDNWVYTPENPGLYIRNRYGSEIYRHAEHWFSTGTGSGWAKYKSGVFIKCFKTGDHTCLDQFKADGDMQFHEWL